jgi:eukaryotic translation initiation factor 2C
MPGGKVEYQMSDAFKLLRRLSKVRFSLPEQFKVRNNREYVISHFEFNPRYGSDGGNAHNVKFTGRDDKEVSVYQHFLVKYGIKLRHPEYPLVVTPKGEYFPVEVCVIKDWQRYPFKLGPDQVSCCQHFLYRGVAK